MSSVHYKFRATIDLKTVRFEGLHILGSDLKREIYAKEKIKPEAFDLILQNSHTKRTYGNEEMVPRNATIIVQRVPKEGAEKLPKIPTGNGGLILRSGTGGDTSTSAGNEVIGHLDEIVMAHMTEEEKLAHMKSISAMKYHSSNFQKRPKGIMTGVPPPTYVCNRCNQTGHWYNNCPTMNSKRVTGLPMDELMETTADDPHAMLHPTGKYVVQKMHWIARNLKKSSQLDDGSGSPADRSLPPRLICPLCKELLRDAVLTTCCGESFCNECVTTALMESDERKCPNPKCDEANLSIVNSVVPNKNVREAVSDWLQSASAASGYASATASPNIDEPPIQRVRIGLNPKVVPSTQQPIPMTQENQLAGPFSGPVAAASGHYSASDQAQQSPGQPGQQQASQSGLPAALTELLSGVVAGQRQQQQATQQLHGQSPSSLPQHMQPQPTVSMGQGLAPSHASPQQSQHQMHVAPQQPPLHHAHPSQLQQPYANVANLPPTSMSSGMIPQQSSRAQLLPPGVERPTHYAGPPPHLAGPISATSSESLVPPGTIVRNPLNMPPPGLGPTGLLSGPIPGLQQIIQRPILPGNYELNLNAAQFAVPGGPVPMGPGMYNRAANVEDKWMEYISRKDQEKMRQRGAGKDRDREKRRHRRRSRSSSASESSSESSGSDREREKRRRREKGKERGRDKERREKRERVTDGRSKHDDKRHEREEKRVVVREREAKRKSGDDRRKRGHEARERVPGSPTKRRRRSDKEEIAVEEEIADEQRPDSREDDEDLIDAQLREVEEYQKAERDVGAQEEISLDVEEPVFETELPEELRDLEEEEHEKESEDVEPATAREESEQEAAAPAECKAPVPVSLPKEKFRPIPSLELDSADDEGHASGREKEDAASVKEEKTDLTMSTAEKESVADDLSDDGQKKKKKKKKHKKEKKHKKNKHKDVDSDAAGEKERRDSDRDVKETKKSVVTATEQTEDKPRFTEMAPNYPSSVKERTDEKGRHRDEHQRREEKEKHRDASRKRDDRKDKVEKRDDRREREEKEKHREREKEREKEKAREREKERGRVEREKEKERERAKEKELEREREREKEKERARQKEREREKRERERKKTPPRVVKNEMDMIIEKRRQQARLEEERREKQRASDKEGKKSARDERKEEKRENRRDSKDAKGDRDEKRERRDSKKEEVVADKPTRREKAKDAGRRSSTDSVTVTREDVAEDAKPKASEASSSSDLPPLPEELNPAPASTAAAEKEPKEKSDAKSKALPGIGLRTLREMRMMSAAKAGAKKRADEEKREEEREEQKGKEKEKAKARTDTSKVFDTSQSQKSSGVKIRITWDLDK